LGNGNYVRDSIEVLESNASLDDCKGTSVPWEGVHALPVSPPCKRSIESEGGCGALVEIGGMILTAETP
jgi:hypothetical protein